MRAYRQASPLRRGVELLSTASLDPILHASDDRGLHLKNELILMTAIEELDSNVEVLLERQIAPVEHVAVEEVRFAGSATLFRLLDQRNHITIEHLGLAVIRVEGHIP